MLNDYFVKIQIYISNMYICTYIHTPHTLIHTSHVYSHTHLCTLHYDTNAASGWLLLEKQKHLPSHIDDDKALWWSQVSAPLDQCFLGGTISSTLWFQAHCVADAHSHDRPEFDQFPELPCIWLLSADFYSFFTLFNSARCWPLLKSVKNCLAFPLIISLLTGQNFNCIIIGIITFLSYILCCHLSVYIPRVCKPHEIRWLVGRFGSPVRGPNQHLTGCVAHHGWHLYLNFHTLVW